MSNSVGTPVIFACACQAAKGAASCHVTADKHVVPCVCHPPTPSTAAGIVVRIVTKGLCAGARRMHAMNKDSEQTESSNT